MNTKQAEEIRALIEVIEEKGNVKDVNITSFSQEPNGTIVIKIEQYFHFFPK